MKQSKIPQSVGIDVAKAKIDVAILWDMSETKIKQFPNKTENDIKKLVLWLKKNGVEKSIPIIVESTGSYHWLSCLLLLKAKFTVYLINPLITKRYERSSIRGAKTDTVDAKRLAEIGIIEKNLPLFFDSKESLSAKKYHSLYAKIQKVRQQLARSYRDAVESAESVGISLNLDSIKECLDQINETLKTIRKIIEENVSETAKQLSEIKGVSCFQASILCNAVQGRTFKNKNQLIAFFGLDIRKRSTHIKPPNA